MHRRTFVRALGALAAAPAALPALASARPARRVGRVGLQLYSLRDAAKQDLARTLADIAAAGYAEVELLGSMRNFGMPPAELRQVLDRHKLRAPSTHVSASALDDLPRQLDEARVLGHRYLIVAGFPAEQRRTVDDYRRWADRLNEAGRRTRAAGVWVGFHNHADDHKVTDGRETATTCSSRAPTRRWCGCSSTPATSRWPGATRSSTRGGTRRATGRSTSRTCRGWAPSRTPSSGPAWWTSSACSPPCPRLNEKHLFVEQESYPGAPLDSVRRDYTYLSKLEF
jgi:hypothetical protein